MIRILYIIPTLDRSGAEKQFTLLATQLPRDQFEIRVLTLTRSGPYAQELEEAGISVECLNKHWKLDPVTWWKLRQHIRQFQPDLIHSWMFTANFYSRLATPTSSKQRPKRIVSERCVDLWKGTDRKWIDRKMINRTDHLLSNSEAVAQFYNELGYPPEKTSVIPNGIETPDTLATAQSKTEFLKAHGFEADFQTICYVGRLSPQKRVADLVWAFQMVKQIKPKTAFFIVGDGPERDKLQELAAQYRCDNLVRFVGHQSEPTNYLQHADCFWLASEYEGMSNSLMEAMACGKPVVVSDIPANRELVDDGEQGYLVKLGDPAGFTQFTRELLDQPELARKMGEAGREKMKTEFSLSQMVDRHVTLYEQLLA